MAAIRRARGQLISRKAKSGETTWLVRISLGRDAQGKRRFHNKTIRGNKKDAERYLTKKLREFDEGDLVEPSQMTLNEFLDRWLEGAARPRVRPRTLQDYRRFLNYVREHLGQRRLDSLGPLDIQGFYTSLGERLSAHAVVHTHRVLSSALAQAVKWRMLARNPAKGASVPAEPRREMCVLTAEEAGRFRKEAAKHPRGFAFTFTLAMGMRPGEVQALQWKDVDLEAGKIVVTRSLVRLKDKGRNRWEFGEPKTRTGRRTLPLPQSLVRGLAAHRASQAQHRLRMGSVYQDFDLVFASDTGTPLDGDDESRRVLKAILKEASLPSRLRWYDLRHTCATLLLAAGENPKVVSERLGHTKVAFTLDRYSHVLPGMQEGASQRLETLLFGS